ncbi:MAG TPA: cytochrome c biogenesis protein CcdA [bacterium]|nr:cytochrome c biogenesis protein CcdA [bacterium]HNS48354.1 cytochrome c biogenesis protein CcdA [bacterium]
MESPSLWLALAAGIGYFFSPCTLPLLPSYLVYLSGVSLPEIGGRKRFAVAAHAALFLAGFLTLFVLLGASATLLGSLLGRQARLIQSLGGVVVVLLGLALVFKPGLLYRLPSGGGRNSAARPAGYFGSFLVGLSFSAAWTGCSSPILGAILVTAATADTVRQGIRLLVAFSLGLALPFLVSALLIDVLLAPLRRFQRHLRKVEVALGILFIAFGLYLALRSFPFVWG